MLLRRLLGRVLRRRRLAQGRTLRDVAAEARVSVPYLSEVERGVKEPSSEVLGSVAEALGLTLEELLRDAVLDLRSLRGGSGRQAVVPGSVAPPPGVSRPAGAEPRAELATVRRLHRRRPVVPVVPVGEPVVPAEPVGPVGEPARPGILAQAA